VPVEVISTDYALQEYGVSEEQLERAAEKLSSLAKKKGLAMGLHGTLGEREALLMPQVLCDERKTFRYLTLMSLVKELNDFSITLGGRPYGVGLFNAFYARQVHGHSFSRLVRLKRELDPNKVMNPGKGTCHMTRYRVPVPRPAYSLAMRVLGFLARLG